MKRKSPRPALSLRWDASEHLFVEQKKKECPLSRSFSLSLSFYQWYLFVFPSNILQLANDNPQRPLSSKRVFQSCELFAVIKLTIQIFPSIFLTCSSSHVKEVVRKKIGQWPFKGLKPSSEVCDRGSAYLFFLYFLQGDGASAWSWAWRTTYSAYGLCMAGASASLSQA